ncbi:acyl carrier protein [Ruminococcus flavefaciens]|jgi:acyl carrier protein|uniref:acyl carrier protein n=1 Tax=Ruminococcus flavefaciens TaxID=1265 RepID=UPI0026EA59D3|nr:acyl carrier protein [Ruminococcus flavefaciens]
MVITDEIEAIWRDTLEIEDDETVDRTKSFFELGGNSLMAMIVIDEIQEKYNCEFEISELYENNTIEKLGQLVENKISE